MRAVILIIFIFIAPKSYSFMEEIKGVEVITIDSSERAIESRFGHTLLRLVSSKNDPLRDIVLSFEANVDPEDGQALKLIRGIVGHYELTVRRLSFFDVIDYYGYWQDRGILRTPLRLTDKELSNLLDVLDKALSGDLNLMPYKFFSNNCANALLEVLRLSEIEFVGNRMIPTRLSSLMYANLLAPWGSYRVTTPVEISNKFKREKPSFDEVKKLSSAELIILSSSNIDLTQEVWDYISDQLSDQRISDELVYNIQSRPKWFYRSDYPVSRDEIKPLSFKLKPHLDESIRKIQTTLMMLQGVYAPEYEVLQSILDNRAESLINALSQ